MTRDHRAPGNDKRRAVNVSLHPINEKMPPMKQVRYDRGDRQQRAGTPETKLEVVASHPLREGALSWKATGCVAHRHLDPYKENKRPLGNSGARACLTSVQYRLP